jgi:hypothetical protein
MGELAEYIDGLPNICGSEQRIEEAIRGKGSDPVFGPPGVTGFADVDSAFSPSSRPEGLICAPRRSSATCSG